MKIDSALARRAAWLDRLEDVIAKDSRTPPTIARDAGIPLTIMLDMLENRKPPDMRALDKILSAFPDEVSIFVLSGLSLNAEDLAFLHLFRRIPQERRSEVMQDLLRTAIPH